MLYKYSYLQKKIPPKLESFYLSWLNEIQYYFRHMAGASLF